MVIELAGLTKFYGGLKALDNLTVQVRPGAIGLLGPNGAGKSTLIKTLLGLVSFTGGEGRVLGHDIRRDNRAIRQRSGYMPEDDCFFSSINAVESVTYAGELAGMDRLETLRRSHEILDFVGLDEERYRPVQDYSTGMKQKVKFAQALIHDPELVFLDEPTNGMDPEGRDRMLKLIRNLAYKRDITVVLSSHLLHDIESVCDAVMILGRGRLLTYDALDNLRKTADESYTVGLLLPSPAFEAALREAGAEVELVEPLKVRVRGPKEIPALVLAVAQKTQTQVRQITPGRNSLEDIFLKAVSGDAHAHL